MEKESNKHQKERINKRKFIQLNAPTSIFIAAIVPKKLKTSTCSRKTCPEEPKSLKKLHSSSA